MKTIKDVSTFCNDFTFYEQYYIERAIELNHVRDCLIRILSKCDFMSEDKFIRVVGVMDDVSLMVLDKNDEILVHVMNSWKVEVLQLLCLENLHKDEAAKEDKEDKDGNLDKNESFHNMDWF